MRVQPRITVDFPDDWEFREQITILAAANPMGEVQANVLASSEPVDPGLESEGYARSMEKRLEEEFPAYREIELEEMDVFGGRSGWMRRFEWAPEPDRAVTQIQIYYAEGGRGYTATATAESEDFGEYQAELVSVLSSMSLDRAPAPTEQA